MQTKTTLPVQTFDSFFSGLNFDEELRAGALYQEHVATRINQLIASVAQLQAHVTNLKGGWTDAEIKATAIPWPLIGETVFRFNSQGKVIPTAWNDTPKQNNCRAFLGIYKTEEDAQAAREVIEMKLS